MNKIDNSYLGKERLSRTIYVLRAISITCVVSAHCESFLSNAETIRRLLGTIGVPCFLICSGYFFNQKQPAKEFWMKKLKNIFLQIGRIKALKYVLVSVIAIVLIGFVDENSVWRHIKNKQTISDLQEEVQKYSELNRRNQEQIRLLDSNPKAIEKIARERYFMKADDEDIFVLSSDLEETTPHETAE